MPRHTSQAEYYRAHRRAFERALKTGVTPAEAQAEIEHEARIARCQDDRRRLMSKFAKPTAIMGPQDEDRGEPWMMRD
ncbi:MAG: hypothetical protein IE933_03415 [Sphingomonadales bacterium]|nr:hypothetical protein [Sphingomonadales bacterium]MBD3772090.1 hypothetical protein [Paracoccaceae bacterium]